MKIKKRTLKIIFITDIVLFSADVIGAAFSELASEIWWMIFLPAVSGAALELAVKKDDSVNSIMALVGGHVYGAGTAAWSGCPVGSGTAAGYGKILPGDGCIRGNGCVCEPAYHGEMVQK